MTAPTPADSSRVRLTILVVVVGCLFVALFARLYFLQVVNAPTGQAVAATNGVRLIYTPAPRGDILDRNGLPLVDNVNVPVIEVDRQIATANPSMVQRLAVLIGQTVKQVDTSIDNVQASPYAPVPVASNATPAQILDVQENQGLYPGVTATTESVRSYTAAGIAAANIVGYVGQIQPAQYAALKNKGYQPGDEIGLAGVEKTYESVLRGTPGVEKVQVDSQGNVLGELSSTPPVQGRDLKLSIDGKVQMAAVAALDQGMAVAHTMTDKVTRRKFSAPAASAVVEDPQNGSLLALATVPSYDPAQFVGGISEAHYQALLNNPADPLEDRTIQGEYAPGSTFKLVTATAGLKYGLITPTSIFDDTGSIKIGTFTAHNDDDEAYGDIDLPTALEVSSDNYFNTIGLKLWYGRVTDNFGDDALQTVAGDYGFGAPTGVALPNESAGKVPTPASYVKDHAAAPKVFQQSQWYPGNSDQLAIGQDELLVSPLQLANAYATFANGGTLYTPRVALDAQTQAGKVVTVYAPHAERTIPLQPAWRSALVAGYTAVVNGSKGTAYGVFGHSSLSGMDIAGKTGTAQVNQPRQNTSVFTSFAPATNPQYVVDAFMEQAGYGASIAAPVVRQIYDTLYNLPVEPIGGTRLTGGAGQG